MVAIWAENVQLAKLIEQLWYEARLDMADMWLFRFAPIRPDVYLKIQGYYTKLKFAADHENHKDQAQKLFPAKLVFDSALLGGF